MPLGPSDRKHFRDMQDIRKEKVDTYINGGNGGGHNGPHTTGIKSKFPGMTYSGGQWIKKN